MVCRNVWGGGALSAFVRTWLCVCTSMCTPVCGVCTTVFAHECVRWCCICVTLYDVCVCAHARTCIYLGMLARIQFGSVDRKLAGIHSESFVLPN